MHPTAPSVPFSFLVLFVVLWSEAAQGDGTLDIFASGDHSHDGTGHDGAHSEGHHDGHHSHNLNQTHRQCGDDHHVATCKGKKPELKVAIAWAMIGLVWFNMCILYLVRRRNVFVQLATFRILSMGISVYCAAMINQTIFSMFAQRGPVEIVAGLVMFFLEYVVLNLLFRCWDRRGWHLHVLESLGGHILAFAGITAFGNVLVSCWFQDTIWVHVPGASHHWLKYVAVLFLVYLGLLGGSCLARHCRHRCFKGEHWLHEVEKAEDEAKGLIIGFLTLQLSLLIITDEPPSLHDHTCKHDHLVPQANSLMRLGVFFLIAMTGVAWFYEKYLVQRRWPNWNIRMGLTMCGAWCIERAAKWWALAFWNEAMVAQVISVFALALGSALCVWVFSEVFLCVTGINAQEGNLHPEEDAAAWDHRPKVEALWKLFNAFAVLNGLAWDHAYQKSQSVIVNDLVEYFSKYFSIPTPSWVLTLAMTCALCAMVIPGWRWYILPEAGKQPQFHSARRQGLGNDLGANTPGEESDASSVESDASSVVSEAAAPVVFGRC